MKNRIIEIPAGQAFIDAIEFPSLIARALSTDEAERNRIYWEHLHAFRAAIENGDVAILNSRRAPTRDLEPGSLVNIANARKYLEPLGIAIVQAEPQTILFKKTIFLTQPASTEAPPAASVSPIPDQAESLDTTGMVTWQAVMLESWTKI